LVSKLCDDAIDGDASGFDQAIGFPSRTDAVFRKEFVDANRVAHWVEVLSSGIRPETQNS
jgi:hypothetical protein